MNKLRQKQLIGVLLFSLAIFVALFTLARGLYYSPGSEEAVPIVAETPVEIPEGEQIAQARTAAGRVVGVAPAEKVTVSLPSRLIIPKLGINAHVQHLGITSSGLMAAPKNFTDVSWYKLGTVPGQRGSAVMSGHEDNAISLDGVFKHLEDLAVGDDVYVTTTAGKKLHFKVTSKEIVPYNLQGAKLNQIFTRSDGTYLNLITCAGDWLPSAKTNDQRLIVYTKLVT